MRRFERRLQSSGQDTNKAVLKMSVSLWLREAEELSVSESSVTVGVASGAFLSANASRIAIIAFPSTVAYTWTDGATAEVTKGFMMAAVGNGGKPFMLHIRDVGQFVQNSFAAISLGAAVEVSIIEVQTAIV